MSDIVWGICGIVAGAAGTFALLNTAYKKQKE